MKWRINTSNPGKFEEFKRLFAKQGISLDATAIDVKEIEADPVSVITHKASQLDEYVLVEDTSLEVDGASIGINIRWLLDHLQDYIGHKAEWMVLLAYRKENEVLIFRGIVEGTLVAPRGTAGFGFDPVFLPLGAAETLAESKPDLYNARAKAIEALVQENVWAVYPAIENWEGPWQVY